MVSINPIRLPGPWTLGYALDRHTLYSIFLGYDEMGKEVFETQRSPMGELLYRFKYRSDASVKDEIIDTVAAFIKRKYLPVFKADCIIPLPPTKQDRSTQPVFEIAQGVAEQIGIDFIEDALKKRRASKPAKDIIDYSERKKIVESTIEFFPDVLKYKNILLFDDLYQSGATAEVVARLIKESGNIGNVVLLVLTKTRT